MALAVAFEDAKNNQFTSRGSGGDLTGNAVLTPLFGAVNDRNKPDLPQAFLSRGEPGRSSRTHFHALNQFQVIVQGGVKVGRHELMAPGVHFARAYTPYGPLVSSDRGMTHLTLRPYHDPRGAQRIPDQQTMLLSLSDRRPWQVFKSGVSFPVLSSDTSEPGGGTQLIPGMQTSDGMSAFALSIGPNGSAMAPDQKNTGGQYLVVFNGSLIHER
jgi:hypothetical protein